MYYPLTQVDLPTPARADHTFVGWWTNPAFIGQPITSVVMDRDRVVYAKWDEIIYQDKLRITISLYNDPEEWQKVVDNQPYYFVRVDDRGREIETLETKLDGFTMSKRTYLFGQWTVPRGKYIFKSANGAILSQRDNLTWEYKKIELETSPTPAEYYYFGVTIWNTAPAFSVLYLDGYFVINEPIEDREANRASHRGVGRVYKALTAENNYTPEWDPGWTYDESAYAMRIKKAVFGSPIKPTSMKAWFNGCRNLTEINTTGLDTSDCTSFHTVFQDCQKLTTCDMSTWDTSKVTNMAGMFNNCRAWLTLNVDNFDTSHVENFGSCFGGMQMETFAPNIDTSSATWFSSMFGYSKCKVLDLRSFDTSASEGFPHMFTSCTELETIIVSDNFVIPAGAGSSNMFLQCYSIVGENGTTYNASKITAEMAHIDTAGDPGYFTGA